MTLTLLRIARCDFGEHKGKFLGHITFEGTGGEIKLTLTPELSGRLFAVVSDEIEAVAKIAAETLRVEVVADRVQK